MLQRFYIVLIQKWGVSDFIKIGWQVFSCKSRGNSRWTPLRKTIILTSRWKRMRECDARLPVVWAERRVRGIPLGAFPTHEIPLQLFHRLQRLPHTGERLKQTAWGKQDGRVVRKREKEGGDRGDGKEVQRNPHLQAWRCRRRRWSAWCTGRWWRRRSARRRRRGSPSAHWPNGAAPPTWKKKKFYKKTALQNIEKKRGVSLLHTWGSGGPRRTGPPLSLWA